MAQRNVLRFASHCGGAAAVAFLITCPLRADDEVDTKQQLRQLQEQNATLQEQLRKQQALIESLSRQVNQIQESTAQRGRELDDLKTGMKDESYSKGSGGFGF